MNNFGVALRQPILLRYENNNIRLVSLLNSVADTSALLPIAYCLVPKSARSTLIYSLFAISYSFKNGRTTFAHFVLFNLRGRLF